MMATKTSPCRPVESSLPMSDAIQNPPRDNVNCVNLPGDRLAASRRAPIQQITMVAGQIHESVQI